MVPSLCASRHSTAAVPGEPHRAAGLLVGAIHRGILNLAAAEPSLWAGRGRGRAVCFVENRADKGRELWEASRPAMAPAAGLVPGTHTWPLPLRPVPPVPWSCHCSCRPSWEQPPRSFVAGPIPSCSWWGEGGGAGGSHGVPRRVPAPLGLLALPCPSRAGVVVWVPARVRCRSCCCGGRSAGVQVVVVG